MLKEEIGKEQMLQDGNENRARKAKQVAQHSPTRRLVFSLGCHL